MKAAVVTRGTAPSGGVTDQTRDSGRRPGNRRPEFRGTGRVGRLANLVSTVPPMSADPFKPYTPYCGLLYNDKQQPYRAESAPMVAISAPTRTGKTRRILAPAAVLHPGPAVCLSSKPDLAKLVIPKRVTGVTGVIDLSPEKTRGWPSDIRTWVSDPTATITTADEALTVAETMLATSGVGIGGATAGSSVTSGGLWELTASKPLACLLYAASPQGNCEGMPWVVQAAENFGLPDPNDKQASDSRAAVLGTTPNGPSFLKAYELCPHPLIAEPILSMLTMDSRMRDSVAITVRKAVAPWVRLGLSTAAELQTLGAVEELSIDSFDISILDEPDATLFVIAPNSGSVAGVAVALVDAIIRHFRRKAANDELTHRLLLELDEVCNSCPLPSLLNYVGESAGLGVNIMATVQASSHFDVVYGPKYADALRDIFPGFLVMYGAHERGILEQASHWGGLGTRRTEAYEANSGSRGQSSVYGQNLEWQEFLPQDTEEAQLVVRGTPGNMVSIPDFDEVMKIFKKALEARNAKRSRHARRQR